ncbi:MAG: hypothetical protein LBT54_02390 [Bifidobacteriaceae bacterium]|jgi:hypothetical protein|nr:hypothetical protein [Bifidobacteriaceae bacterium]
MAKKWEADKAAITAVAEEFLAALEAGDGPRAMSLAKVADDAVVCQEVVDNYGQVRDRPRDAKVAKAMAGLDLENAAVQVTYRQGVGDRELSALVQLEARDGSFVVDLTKLPVSPVPVGVAMPASGPSDSGVGDFRMLSFTIDGECQITGTEAYYTVLPGTYSIAVEDPGDLAAPEAFLLTTGLAEALFTELKPEYHTVAGSLADGVLGEVRSALAELVYKCAKSRLAGPACPASVRKEADRIPESGGEVEAPSGIGLSVLAQDSDGNWQMTSMGMRFTYRSGRVFVSAKGVYSGTVRRDESGAVVIDLDE